MSPSQNLPKFGLWYFTLVSFAPLLRPDPPVLKVSESPSNGAGWNAINPYYIGKCSRSVRRRQRVDIVYSRSYLHCHSSFGLKTRRHHTTRDGCAGITRCGVSWSGVEFSSHAGAGNLGSVLTPTPLVQVPIFQGIPGMKVSSPYAAAAMTIKDQSLLWDESFSARAAYHFCCIGARWQKQGSARGN